MKRAILLIAVLFLFSNINAQWQKTNGPYGAYIRCTVVNGTTVFAGGQYSQLYKSTDNGLTWSNVNLPINGPAIMSLAASGNNIYAGTIGSGILLSTDNGTNWSKISGVTATNTIYSLAASGSKIFAGADNSKIFLSTDNGINWTLVNSGLPSNATIWAISILGSKVFAGTSEGVYLSTNDGASWTSVNSGISNTYIRKLVNDGTNIYAGCNSDLYKSTDYGTSWVSLNFGRSAEGILIDGSSIYSCVTGEGLYKTTNNGSSWTRIFGYSGTYYEIVKSASRILIACEGGIIASSDNGSNWSASNNGIIGTEIRTFSKMGSNILAGCYQTQGIFSSSDNGNSWNPMNSASWIITINKMINDGTKLFVGSNGYGVFMTSNNGNSWATLNTGLTNSIIYSLAISGTNIFAGTSGSGVFVSTNNGTSWTAANTGISTAYVYDILVNGSKLFIGTNNNIYISTDNGNSWTPSSFSGINVQVLKLNNGKIYAGTYGQGIYVSSDNGTSWTNITNGTSYTNVYGMAFDNNNNIYASAGAEIIMSKDNGAHWMSIYQGSTGNSSESTRSLETNDNYLFAGTLALGVWRRPLSDFTTFVPNQVTALTPTVISQTSFQAVWNSAANANGYLLDVATDNTFTNFVTGYNHRDVSNVTSYNVSGLTANTTYYFRVYGYNSDGNSATGNTIEVKTLPNLPSAPVNQTATLITTTGFTATWTAVSGATGYYLDVATDLAITAYVSGFINKDVGNITTYAVTGLSSNTNYYYRIRAYNTGGASSNSNIITVKTLPPLPTIPQITSNSKITQTSFKVIWTAVTAATKYFLDVSTVNDFTTYVSGYENKDVGNVTSYLVFGLQSNTTYYYRLRAYNSTGTSANSYVTSITTRQNNQWIQTSGPSTEIGGPANTAVKYLMTMGNNVYAGAYYSTGIYITTNNGTTWSKLFTSTNDIIQLINDGTNIYAATNGAGVYYSSDNGTTWLQRNTGLTKLQVFSVAKSNTNLFAATNGDGVFLSTDNGSSWNAINTGLTQKNINTIHVSGTYVFAGSSSAGIFVSTNNGTSWTQTSLTGKNVITIKSNNNKIYAATFGGGIYVSSDNGTTWSQINNGLTNLYCYAITFYSTNNLFCSTGNSVFYSSNSGTNWANISDNLPGIDTWIFEISGNDILIGSNELGVFKRSLSEICVTAPATPVAIAATAITKTGFTANWNAVTGATGYYLDIATNNTFTNFVTGYNNKDVSNVTTYAVTNLTPNTSHYYRVRAYNSVGTSDNSNTSNVILVGVNDEEKIPTEYILEQNYPNPFNPSTTINYQIPEASFVTLKVYDVLGNEVAILLNEEKSAGIYKVKFDASNLSSGIYLYKLTAGSFSQTKKLILMK